MVVLFISAILMIALLVMLMFFILKKTVTIVNSQTKSYFVSKLQGYDELITDKENKLQQIDEQIKNKEKGIEEEYKKVKGTSLAFDTKIIDIFNETKYQNKNVLQINKLIDEQFVVNYDELISDFLTLCKDEKNYDFCVQLREKFDSETIYNLLSKISPQQEEEIKRLLDKKEYRVYEAFKLMNTSHHLENFIDYLDQLVDLNNPKVTILVGNKNENYDHLSSRITTKYNDKIYRGIKIVYRNKVYDFSLSERNV